MTERMRRPTFVILAVMGVLGAGCVPAVRAGSLPATLTMADVAGGTIALQNDIAVPTFDFQPRPRIDLDGRWRVEPATLDAELSLSDRDGALEQIEEEAAGRHESDHDDRAWPVGSVPGTLNAPPDEPETGGWFRRRFAVPASWIGRSATLKFSSANYVADVWVNGAWVGYHEGGSTPFAFDVSADLLPGSVNQIAVRVDNPAWGTRTDIAPWGLGDWWNYGGLTGPVWIEAAPAVHVVRADVVPHLDAAEVSVVVRASDSLVGQVDGDATEDEPAPDELVVRATLLSAEVTEENVLDLDPRALLTPVPRVLDERETTIPGVPAGEHGVASIAFSFAEADLWRPGSPALYVMRVVALSGDDADQPRDARDAAAAGELWTTFGLRDVSVDERSARLLLNGEPAFLEGVGLHDEELTFDADGELLSGEPGNGSAELRERLAAAAAVNATLLRPGHTPADPDLLLLADRLGFAVWEEIPLYHFTPQTFQTAMSRGIPQQMLREMALRDMNRPSVLFHGLANESTGEEARAESLAELHAIDREIDGTRLTGQAAYAWDVADPSHAPLDVAGFTFYFGVFYGQDVKGDTGRALRRAHEAFPTKPIVVLEFGRWADTAVDEERQAAIFEETHRVLERYRGDQPGGFVALANWWTLSDFATQWPGIRLEQFGLYRPDGTLRPAGSLVAEQFSGPPAAPPVETGESQLRPAVDLENPTATGWRLAGYLAYAFLVSTGMIGSAALLLIRRGGRATGRRRRRPGGIRR